MILGLDWLISLGPLKVDWGKGQPLMRGKGYIAFNDKDREVPLQVQEEKAEPQILYFLRQGVKFNAANKAFLFNW